MGGFTIEDLTNIINLATTPIGKQLSRFEEQYVRVDGHLEQLNKSVISINARLERVEDWQKKHDDRPRLQLSNAVAIIGISASSTVVLTFILKIFKII